jgi:cytochrome d ubiquinol oxidase subunit II
MPGDIYPTIWFIVLGVMLTGYAILDGFDLGIGTILHLVGRNEGERSQAIDSIGPVWNGNEVWLLAAGGSMAVAFPFLYAKAFSGLYLTLMLVLWMLILRGVSLEFRHQVAHPLWKEIWDIVFSVASFLLALLFGVAVANVLRGVPQDAAHRFTATLTMLLNPFAILGGLLSVATLALHGAAYLATKTEGVVQQRARGVVARMWFVVLLLVAAIVAYSFGVRPDYGANFVKWPYLWILPLIGVAALAALPGYARKGLDHKVFTCSAALIGGLLFSAGAGLYPRMLPVPYGHDASRDLTILNASSSRYSQSTALVIFVIAIAIVAVYITDAYRTWAGKVSQEGGHYS